MGKGYNNFMCKKPFHPGSRDNIKRVWMAEQRSVDEKKKQEDLKKQYEKEQDLYSNRLLVSTESKDKLSLNFMYEAPPGVKKEREKEDDEPEFKFEWQRNAPRESFAKNNMEIRDQPFGIQVRNVRCLKCHKWGHINTDRDCPMYNETGSLISGSDKMNPEELIKAMQEDGLALKKSIVGHTFDSNELNQMMLPSAEEDPETAFLKSLSRKQKKKLLEKLNKLSGASSSRNESPSSSSKKSKKHKRDKDDKDEKESNRKRRKSSSDSGTSSSRHKSHSSSKKSKKHKRDRDEKKDRDKSRKRKLSSSDSDDRRAKRR